MASSTASGSMSSGSMSSGSLSSGSIEPLAEDFANHCGWHQGIDRTIGRESGPKITGGDFERRHIDDCKRPIGRRTTARPAPSIDHNRGGQRHHLFGPLPSVESARRVGADHQEQLIRGIGLPNLGESICHVTLAASSNLDVGHYQPVESGDCLLNQRQTNRRLSHIRCSRLLPRIVGHDQQHTVEPKAMQHFLGYGQMTEMRRVKRSSEYSRSQRRSNVIGGSLGLRRLII